jgi:hypothetical protein
MFASRLKNAIALTDPHPFDERVLVTESPAGLSAIFSKEVRAVIWPRTLQDHVNAELDAMDFKNMDWKISLRAPFIKSLPWATKVVRQPDAWRLEIPTFIERDMAEVAGHFRKAQGLLKYETDKILDLVSCYNYRSRPNGIDYADTIKPHQDGAFCPRLITTYSTHPEMGTVWYPGELDNEMLNDFAEQLKAANDPQVLLDQFDEEHSAQRIGCNDVLVIKGMVEGVEPQEVLTHRAATPLVGVRRMALVIS